MPMLAELMDVNRPSYDAVNTQATVMIMSGGDVVPMSKPALINLTCEDIHIRRADGSLIAQIPAIVPPGPPLRHGEPIANKVNGEDELLYGTAVIPVVNRAYSGFVHGLPAVPVEGVTYIVPPIAALAAQSNFERPVWDLRVVGDPVLNDDDEVIGYLNLARVVS